MYYCIICTRSSLSCLLSIPIFSFEFHIATPQQKRLPIFPLTPHLHTPLIGWDSCVIIPADMTMVLLTNPLAWRRRLSIVINVITKRPYQQTSTQETSDSGSEWCVVTQNIIRPHSMHTQRLIYALRKFSNVPCTARGRHRCKQAQLGSATIFATFTQR